MENNSNFDNYLPITIQSYVPITDYKSKHSTKKFISPFINNYNHINSNFYTSFNSNIQTIQNNGFHNNCNNFCSEIKMSNNNKSYQNNVSNLKENLYMSKK